MSSAEVIASSFTRRRTPAAPLLLLLGSLVLYIGVAFSTGQTRMLEVEGVVGLLQRMVALGIVAIGQTFVILGGSIDLSVANLISVGAVLASFIMQGRPEMMFVAVIVVLAVSAIVGLINGVLVSRLQVSPFIATLGSGLILQGLLSASFTNFAGSVPIEFQALAYGALGPLPYSVIGLFLLAILASILMRATKFGAHLYAVGGNAEGARLAGIRTDLVTIGAHVLCSLTAGVSGLYLASRLRSGAPWVGRDGVYDLESIAVVVIGGTLLAGGRGGKVLALRILPGVDVLETRWSAANRIFKENGVNVVGAEFTGGDNAKTKQIVEDYINRNGKIDAVWMDAGATAVAALEAFEDSGQPYPIITGEDQEDFLKKWKEKGLTAMAPTYPTYQWRAPVIAAVKVLKGEPVIGPTWKLPQPVITQADLDKYVGDKMPPLHYAMCGCKDLPGYPQRWGGK
jgi:ribose transport system permease protein